MRDLNDTRLIYLKGVLFLVMLAASAVLLILEPSTWKRAVLVAIVIWSSARLYYFMFYVIEKYTDPAFKFAGILSFLQYLLGRRRT